MKDEIFRLLKQAYSPLGLGDAILLARAEMLDSLGFVTAENMNDVITKQKPSLEALQKANDARVTEALRRHDEDVRKKADEEARKAEKKASDEAAARKAAEDSAKAAEQAAKAAAGLPPEIKAYLDEMDRRHAEDAAARKDAYDKTIKELRDSIKGLTEARRTEEAARARADRRNMILGKARELGIPQSRIDEGFVIADDADDAAIGEYLGTVKKNIDAIKLPQNSHFLMSDGKPSTDEIGAIADSLLGR